MRLRFPGLGRVWQRVSQPAMTPASQPYAQPPTGLTRGGYRNPTTGAGVPGIDRAETGYWTPTWYWSREQLQTLYVQSWAAEHFIDIPIDDMFVRWRQWEGDAAAAAERMQEAERQYQIRDRLSRAMKAGRLYGTGLLVIHSRDAPMDLPLRAEQVRAGDISHLAVYDRYSLSVLVRDGNPQSPTHNQPLVYLVYPQTGQPFAVHHTRALRFDGIKPLADDGYTLYDRDWGVSNIVPVVIALVQDQSAASAASSLLDIASIDVVKMAGYKEALAGQAEIDDPTPEQIGQKTNILKSVYRTMFLDAEDDFERHPVTFSGLPDLLDRMARRISAAAQIPATRFWGQSPVGLNATGESDMVNYAQSVMAMQERLLTAPLYTLDRIVARSVGLREPPAYRWLPLTDMSESEKAGILQTKVTALSGAIAAGIIDEDEARAALDGDELLGALPGVAPGPAPMPDASDEEPQRR